MGLLNSRWYNGTMPHAQQIKLRTFGNKTNISFLTEIEGTIKADVPKSTQAVVNTHTTQIDSLNNELERVKKLEESTVSTVVTDKDFVVVEQTSNGYFEDVELKGRTLVNIGKFSELFAESGCTKLSNGVFRLESKNGACRFDSNRLKEPCTVMLIPNNKEPYTVHTMNGSANITVYGKQIGAFTTCLDNPEITRIRVYSESTSNTPIDMTMLILANKIDNFNYVNYFEGLESVGEGTDEIVVSSVSNGIVYENIPTKKGSYISDTGVFEPNSNATAFDYLEIVPGITYGIFTSKYTTIAHRVCYFDKDRKFVESELLNSIPSKFKVDDRKVRYIAGHFATNTYDSELKMNIFIKDDKSISQTDKKQPLFLDDADNTWKKPILDELSTVKKGSDGKYRYYKRGEKVVLDGSENWKYHSSKENTSFFQLVVNNFNLPTNDNIIAPIINDKFKNVAGNTGFNNDIECIYLDSRKNLSIRMSKSKLETQDVAGFKKWLQANPVTVVYQLHEEKVYECTNIDLITYANETNYIVKSGVLSPKTTLKVHSNIGNVVNLLQKKVSLLESNINGYMVTQNRLQLNSTYSADQSNFRINVSVVNGREFEVELDYDLLKLIKANVLVGRDNYDRIKIEEILDFYVGIGKIDYCMWDEIWLIMELQHNPPIEEAPQDEVIK